MNRKHLILILLALSLSIPRQVPRSVRPSV